VTLELGGNAGCIIHNDADLESAVPMVAAGGFGQAGQSCISVQRVLIHEDRYEEFRSRLVEHIRARIKTGDPGERDTVVGPMIKPEALAKIRERIAAAERAGARVVHGGAVIGNCLEATVIEDAPATSELCADEAFAPMVTLHRYRDFDQALEFRAGAVPAIPR
jgi:acyl-CoA reductase-like NAD-dependent aldehyde dehydrogenase